MQEEETKKKEDA